VIDRDLFPCQNLRTDERDRIGNNLKQSGNDQARLNWSPPKLTALSEQKAVQHGWREYARVDEVQLTSLSTRIKGYRLTLGLRLQIFVLELLME